MPRLIRSHWTGPRRAPGLSRQVLGREATRSRASVSTGSLSSGDIPVAVANEQVPGLALGIDYSRFDTQ